VRACYATLDMQAAIRRDAERVRRSDGISLEIRVGLNSGEVVVRAIGSDLHMDYTAVGQTTHLAARMEQLATGNRSLLTADTLRLAEGYVEAEALGPVPVKGLDAPVEVFELTRVDPLRSRLRVAAACGLTRFVGRDAEPDQLRRALSRTASGHGQVVAIVGEPGVGKSRAVWELTHSHQTHCWLIVQGGSVSYGKADSVSARHRPAEGLLPDRGPGRLPRDPREGAWEAAGPRRGAPPRAALGAGVARRGGRGRRVAMARSTSAPAAHAGCGQAGDPPGESAPAAARGVRGSPLD
jgi:hypothetical protein